MARNAVVVVLSILVVVLICIIWLFLPQIQSAAPQIIVGKVGIPLGAVWALWQVLKLVTPEGTKLFVASLFRKIWHLPTELKRVTVRNEIEGNLNRAVREFGHEGCRLLPHPVSVEWVSPANASPESFFANGRIIVRLDYSDNPHRNIVETAILYCRAGLIPETRCYLWGEFRRALDLVFVQAILERNNLREGLLYFKQDVLEQELETSPDIGENYNTLHQLHERGYFIRILLPELRDYAGKVHRADTQAQHRQWITNFVSFLVELTHEPPPETKRALDHIAERFRVSVIIIGIWWKLAFEGQKPYLKRIARCSVKGARTIFLTGTCNTIPDIAKNALKFRIVDSIDYDSYHASWRGEIRQMWCARLDVSEQTAAVAADFLKKIENWPDFEAIIETGEAETE